MGVHWYNDPLIQNIITVLTRAASIKSDIIPLCKKEIRYHGKKLGYRLCVSCYPNEPQYQIPRDCTMSCNGCCRKVKEK